MQNVSLFILLSVISFSSTAVGQQVYRWVDDEGKVHYGDRPPQTLQADDISDDINNTNVDTSTSERAKVGKIFAKETASEKRLKKEKHHKQSAAEHNRRVACENARKRLKVLEERPFYIVDSDGNGHDVSMKEKDQMIAAQRAAIRKNCR
ncbi:hypothetical protein NBRC116494_30840 [Aurantivibrio plasticivorans]